jgi:hypothetical protein
MMPVLRTLSGELGLATLLLVTAVGVDFAWVRPAESEVERLSTQKKAVERTVMLGLREQAEWEALREYLGGDDPETWRGRYRAEDPLQLLEELREESGLRRHDVRLHKREPQPPFLKTTYFLSIAGDFSRQLTFIKALEQAAPLVTVDSFIMEREDRDSRITSKMNVSVLTISEGDSP